MAVTRERFEQGMPYEAYKAQMTRNRDRLQETEQTVALDAADIHFFEHLPQPLHVLVLAEDWCGDVIANVPVLARLADASGKLNLRVFLRDQNLDLMDQYLNAGTYRSIPVFVFFDQAFREIGHWIERPALINELQGNMVRNLFTTDPALQGLSMDLSPAQLPEAARTRLMQALLAFRADTRRQADREVVRELRALVEHGLANTA